MQLRAARAVRHDAENRVHAPARRSALLAAPSSTPRDPVGALLGLQRCHGNRFVRRVVAPGRDIAGRTGRRCPQSRPVHQGQAGTPLVSHGPDRLVAAADRTRIPEAMGKVEVGHRHVCSEES